MRARAAHRLRFGHRWPTPRGPLSACLVLAAALAFLVTPRAPSTARVLPIPDAAAFTPVAPADPEIRNAPAIADLLVVGRGDLRPLEGASRLFWQAEGGMHGLIATAAAANGLPPDFFLRLLRQESGLNPMAVSPVGAQGIAQFMPGTAAERGLSNPFDPAEAIPKSAELLREHRDRFGNLGLAAAAYNAGPQRVRGWLDGRSGMPAETRDYVLQITGRTIEDWAAESGRTMPGPMLAFVGANDLGLTSTLPTDSFSRQASLSVVPQGPRAVAPPTPRPIKRLSQRPSARSQQVRSEQALCSLLNSEGHTCLVQATY